MTLVAHHSLASQPLPLPQAAWYRTPHPTFADALALVRHQLWDGLLFCWSPHPRYVVKVPRAFVRAFVEHLTDSLCYAA